MLNESWFQIKSNVHLDLQTEHEKSHLEGWMTITPWFPKRDETYNSSFSTGQEWTQLTSSSSLEALKLTATTCRQEKRRLIKFYLLLGQFALIVLIRKFAQHSL